MSDSATRRRIRAQASAGDDTVMAFILDAPVQPGASARFDATSDAPLARALFALDGVSRVQVSGPTIWVKTTAATGWGALKPAIASAIREVLDDSEAPLGRADAKEEAAPDTDRLDAVAQLLDRQVNPAVAAHGGRISVDRVEGGTVHLRMSGGCQGCAASSATLRQGVERMLRAALPWIEEIVDVTDHEAGSSPFYARENGPSPVLHRPVPEGAILREGDQISVDPDYLAPRLGLTPEALRDGLRNGEVVGVTETGVGGDAGKTRVVLRGAGRAWAAEIDASGAAREIPPPRTIAAAAGSEQDLADRARAHLGGLEERDIPMTYGALARALGLWMPGSVGKVTRALETTMREDAAAGRPFIAARAVNRGSAGLPGKGFFDLARALALGPRDGESDADFHAGQLEQLNALARPPEDQGSQAAQ